MQTAIRAVAGFALAALLAACGFHLRGDVTYAFATLQVTGPPQSPIVIELKRTLQSSGNVKLVEVPKDAQAILDVTNVSDDKGVLSLSGGGRVSEYVLTKRVSFNLHDIEGRDWMPAGEITVRRSYTFSESEVLARQSQEQQMLRDMQTDVVQQIIRRLQAAKKPVA